MGNPDTKLTPQYIKNRSFDPAFNTSQIELVGFDSVNNVLRPIKVDANGQVYVSGALSQAAADALYLKLTAANQTLTGNLNITGTLGAGAITGTSLTDSGLTITRIPYATTGGLLTDTSALTLTSAGLMTLVGTATTDGLAVTSKLTITGLTGGEGLVGSAVSINSGGGGAKTSGAGVGGAGGTVNIIGAAGGAGSVTGGTGGAGAPINITTGSGGAGTTKGQAGHLTVNLGTSTTASKNADFIWQSGGTEMMRLLSQSTAVGTGRLGIHVAAPTATLHLGAGNDQASSAPLKFTSNATSPGLLETPEVGAVEFMTDDLYFTITTDAARKAFVFDNGARLTSGKIPIATTNGRLTDGQTPLSGTKVYYVSDASGGTVNRKLTFINGILTSET